MKKIRFGVVGCGRIGTRHIEHILKNPRAQLIAVCDIIKNKADTIALKHNTKSFYEIEEFLNEDIDVVNVCTPSGLHAEMSVASLLRGKHVLCEKPMAINLIDADRIVDAEKTSGKKFFLVKQNRYNPPIKALKDCIFNDKLGKLILIGSSMHWNRTKEYYDEAIWRGTMKLDGGALMTQCSHFLDLMIWIGGQVKGVYAKMSNLSHDYIEVEDTGMITIHFENGAIGSLQYTTSTYKKNLEGSITVLGTNGSIKIGGEYLNKCEYWDVNNFEMPKFEAGNPPNDYGNYKGSMSNHDKVIENVIAVLLDGEKIATNSLQGRQSIEVMQAAYVSALNEKVVFLPLKSNEYSFKINDQKPLSGNKKLL